MQSREKGSSLRIPVGPITLSGDLVVPEGAQGLVLFVHGSGSSRHSPRNRFVASVLQQAGLATLLFDLLTEEEETEDLMTGQLRFNIQLLAQRVAQATEWVSQQEQTQGRLMGYFGASTGAAAALVAAADRTDIAAIVSRGGRPDLAGEALARVQVPTLLIVGSRDTYVIELNRVAQEHLQTVNELRIVPGASHLFEEPGTLEQVAASAADWLSRYLGHKARHLRVA